MLGGNWLETECFIDVNDLSVSRMSLERERESIHFVFVVEKKIIESQLVARTLSVIMSRPPSYNIPPWYQIPPPEAWQKGTHVPDFRSQLAFVSARPPEQNLKKVPEYLSLRANHVTRPPKNTGITKHQTQQQTTMSRANIYRAAGGSCLP